MTTESQTGKSPFLRWGIGGFLCVWLLAFIWFVQVIPSERYLTSGLRPGVDAVVVLTGGVRRVEHGMELYMRDGAKALFISGVGKDVKYRELEALYAPHVNSEKLEAKKQNVFLGYTAHNTIGNAKETAEWMEKHGFKSMLLVTSNYHIPRSVMEFRHLMPKVTIIPEPVFSQEVMDGREWWASFSAVKMLLLEFHKYCFRRIYLWLAEI